MENLLVALNKLYDDQNNFYTDLRDGKPYFNKSELLDEVTELCNQNLITESGGCNLDNFDILRKNGYLVYAGEKDSFGWLIGCVQKKGDRRIVYYG